MALPLRSKSEKAEQLNLFEVEEKNETSSVATNGSAFNDPAFAQNKTLPVHRWVPWIAGFSSDFVHDAISRYLDSKGTVLDPFAGVGTTLVEAILSGHHAIGFEINPYAALACRTKLQAHLLDMNTLKREIARFKEFCTEKISSKVYGGNGWANYAAAYFNDCYKFAKGINHVLKSGGTALVVIGNSILQGITIPTDQYFGQIAESIGLELVDIHIPRATRVGNSIIQSAVRVAKAKDSHQLYEAVVELRKK